MGWSAAHLLVLLYVGLHLGWRSSLETTPLADTAEPPNLELSEVDDPDVEAVPRIEDPPEAPRPPTAGSSNVGHRDPERTVSGSNSRVDMLTGNKNALFVVAAILGNVVSVTLFDVSVLFTEIIDHEHGRALMMGKSRDGSVPWHWDMATPRKDHSLKQLFTIFRDAESLARVGLVCKHDDLRGRGLKAEQVLTVGPLHSQLQSPHTPCLCRHAEPQTGGRPEHVAPFETCMGSAHEVRTRCFTQLLAQEMVGCLIVASWRVDPGGLRLASGENLAKSAAVVARCAGGRLFLVRHEGRSGRIQLHASPRPLGPLRHDAAIGAVAQSGAQQLGRRSWWEARSRRAAGSLRERGSAPQVFVPDCRRRPFRLGHRCVRKWVAQKDWHKHSASNFCQNVNKTSALVEFESDFTTLQELWRSELSQVETVSVHRNDLLESTACWVLHSSAVGALVVDVKIVPVGSKWLEQWPVEGDENLRIVHVTPGRDWFDLLTEAAAPRECFEAMGSHTLDACVSLECHTNTPHPILELCARRALRGLRKTLHVEIHGFGRLHLGRAEADLGT